MATLHEYPVTVEWSGGREGSGEVLAGNSGTKFDIAVPPEYQGSGGAANPEELLTSAVASCYSITFGIVVANRKLPVVGVRTEATGIVERNGTNLVFTKVILRPAITAEAGATSEQLAAIEEVANKADAYCLITNAVRDKVEIVVEPTVRIA